MATHITTMKPSELIYCAVRDLRSCEQDDRYEVAMGNWHSPGPCNEICSVCLAGAVMAKTLGADHDKFLRPSHFPDATNLLDALDWLRQGVLHRALYGMGLIPGVWDLVDLLGKEPEFREYEAATKMTGRLGSGPQLDRLLESLLWLAGWLESRGH